MKVAVVGAGAGGAAAAAELITAGHDLHAATLADVRYALDEHLTLPLLSCCSFHPAISAYSTILRCYNPPVLPITNV